MLDYGPGILAALIFVLAVVKPFGRNSFLQISLTKDRARRNAGRLPCRPRMRILSPKKRRAAIFATFLSRNDIDAFERPQEENARRSEEHTSELQSLMRISYAVFCLKKKNQYADKISQTMSSPITRVYGSDT